MSRLCMMFHLSTFSIFLLTLWSNLYSCTVRLQNKWTYICIYIQTYICTCVCVCVLMKLKNWHNLSWDSLSNKGSFFLVVVCLWPLGCSCLPFTCYALVMSDCQLFSLSAAVLQWIRYSGWATRVEKLKCRYEKAVLDNNSIDQDLITHRPFSMTAVIRTWCFCPVNCVHDDSHFFLDCWGLSCDFRFHSTPRCWASFIYRVWMNNVYREDGCEARLK